MKFKITLGTLSCTCKIIIKEIQATVNRVTTDLKLKHKTKHDVL